MKKYLMLPLLLVFMLSCAAQSVPPQTNVDLSKIHNDVLVTCVSKLDNSTLSFLQSQKIETKSKFFNDYTISQIVDIYGKHWLVNQTEWTNLNCTKKVLP